MNLNTPKQPRDFDEANRTGLVLFARQYSNFVSPSTIYAALGFAICFSVMPFWSAIGWGIAYGLLVSLFPIIVVLLMLHFGYVEELHISNTRERRIPYLAAISGSLVMWGLAYYFNLQDRFLHFALFNVLNLVMLFLITIYWLISMHTAGAAAFSALIGVIWGWVPAFLIGLPVLISVTAARLYLRRHSPAQAFGGIFLGLSTVGFMHWLGYFS
ncbi:MAG: hypothetical protein ACI9EW_001600 [Cellvibrionaceae bacterium]